MRSSASGKRASSCFELSPETAQLLIDADRLCRPYLERWVPWYASDDMISAAWGAVMVRICEEQQTWDDYDGIEAWLVNWCRQWTFFEAMAEVRREQRRIEHAPISIWHRNANGYTIAETIEHKTQLQILREKWSDSKLQTSYDKLPPKMRAAIDCTVMCDREPADAAPYVEEKASYIGGTRLRALARIAKENTDGQVTKPVSLKAGGKAGRRKTKGNIHWLQASA